MATRGLLAAGRPLLHGTNLSLKTAWPLLPNPSTLLTPPPGFLPAPTPLPGPLPDPTLPPGPLPAPTPPPLPPVLPAELSGTRVMTCPCPGVLLSLLDEVRRSR